MAYKKYIHTLRIGIMVIAVLVVQGVTWVNSGTTAYLRKAALDESRFDLLATLSQPPPRGIWAHLKALRDVPRRRKVRTLVLAAGFDFDEASEDFDVAVQLGMEMGLYRDDDNQRRVERRGQFAKLRIFYDASVLTYILEDESILLKDKLKTAKIARGLLIAKVKVSHIPILLYWEAIPGQWSDEGFKKNPTFTAILLRLAGLDRFIHETAPAARQLRSQI